jgi:UDP-N-acetylmuramate dehydrogenase
MSISPFPSLLPHMPDVKGRLSEYTLLSKTTWFQVGGPAQLLYKPENADELSYFLAHKPTSIPVTTIGVGSNLLVRDGGIEGVVLRLGRGFAEMMVTNNQIQIGSGALDINAALFASQYNLGGFEFLSGIPGTIGGALRMNAGAYGREIKDIFISAIALDPKGKVHKLTIEDMGFSMRHCAIPQDWIFVSAILQGYADDPQIIADKNKHIKNQRESTQPVKSRTGGSTFVNPIGFKAWELIEQAGCRGLRYGNAMISDLHCNFLINTGDATAYEIETLGQQVQTRVFEKSGILLEWEIKRIGQKLNDNYPAYE